MPKVTVPAPLVLLQVVVRVPEGSPSSLAVPDRLAVAGRVMVWLLPAATTGAVFTAPPPIAALRVVTLSAGTVMVMVVALVSAKGVSAAQKAPLVDCSPLTWPVRLTPLIDTVTL